MTLRKNFAALVFGVSFTLISCNSTVLTEKNLATGGTNSSQLSAQGNASSQPVDQNVVDSMRVKLIPSKGQSYFLTLRQIEHIKLKIGDKLQIIVPMLSEEKAVRVSETMCGLFQPGLDEVLPVESVYDSRGNEFSPRMVVSTYKAVAKTRSLIRFEFKSGKSSIHKFTVSVF